MTDAPRRSARPTGTPLRTIRDHAATPSETVALDSLDLRLLRLLSSDARMSQRSIARALRSVEPPPERPRRLPPIIVALMHREAHDPEKSRHRDQVIIIRGRR